MCKFAATLKAFCAAIAEATFKINDEDLRNMSHGRKKRIQATLDERNNASKNDRKQPA